MRIFVWLVVVLACLQVIPHGGGIANAGWHYPEEIAFLNDVLIMWQDEQCRNENLYPGKTFYCQYLWDKPARTHYVAVWASASGPLLEVWRFVGKSAGEIIY